MADQYNDIQDFDAQRQQLARRRKMAEELLRTEAPSQYFVPGQSALGGIGAAFSRLAGGLNTRMLNDEEQQLARQEREAQSGILSSIPAAQGEDRRRAQEQAFVKMPSLRGMLESQMKGDYASAEAEAKRIEAGEQKAEDRRLREADMLDRSENRAADRVAREEARRIPTTHITVSNSGNGAGNENLAGAVTKAGINPRDDSDVFRHTKSGQLFQYIDGKPAVYSGAIASAPDSSTRKATNEAKVGIANIDDAIAELGKPEGKDATGPLYALPGSEMAGQYLDPKGVPARAAVSNIGSLKLHDRSGAAVTVSEFPRLAPFIPKVSDSPAVAAAKLQKMKTAYAAEVASWKTAAPGQQPPAPTVVRTGTRNGIKVEQLSDGTIREVK